MEIHLANEKDIDVDFGSGKKVAFSLVKVSHERWYSGPIHCERNAR